MAPWKRKGRHTFEFQAVLASGDFTQLSTRVKHRPLAGRIEGMWNELAREHRAWDVLDRVLAGTLRIDRLYDAWVASRFNVVALRFLLDDVDIEALVEPYLKAYRGERPADTVAHAERHLRYLLPAGEPRRASTVTPAWLSERLASYADSRGKAVRRNTRRKVHSSWSRFFDAATRLHSAFQANPMLAVGAPALEASPIQFLELEEVERVIGAQPTAARRCAFALAYGGAIEASVVVGLHRRDVHADRQEVRAAGTKAHSRDRVCLIADWAWPHVAGYIADLLPGAPLFPGVTRWTLSDWHRETLAALGISPTPLKNARDHWAVRMARIGTPIAVIQQQLGHGSPTLTLRKYGRWIPSGADRAKWERKASRDDQRRRDAK